MELGNWFKKSNVRGLGLNECWSPADVIGIYSRKDFLENGS